MLTTEPDVIVQHDGNVTWALIFRGVPTATFRHDENGMRLAAICARELANKSVTMKIDIRARQDVAEAFRRIATSTPKHRIILDGKIG